MRGVDQVRRYGRGIKRLAGPEPVTGSHFIGISSRRAIRELRKSYEKLHRDAFGLRRDYDRMVSVVTTVPDVGYRCVVLGRHLAKDGRKSFTASAAYDSAGHLLHQLRRLQRQHRHQLPLPHLRRHLPRLVRLELHWPHRLR